MDEFKISLNPGIRPTQFRFVYNHQNSTWHIWQYDEIQEEDLVGGFFGWPPIEGSEDDNQMHSFKGDFVAKISLNTGVKPFTFKMYFDPIDALWYIWMRDEAEGKSYLSNFNQWPLS